MKILEALGYFLTTLMIYLLVPLVGWGLDDLNGFFSLGPRLGYAVSVVLMGLGIFWQALDNPQGFRGGSGEEGKLIPRQRIVRNLIIGFVYLSLVFLPFSDRRNNGTFPDSQIVRWVGFVLSFLGFLFIFWSGVSHGKYYSADATLQEDHQIIQNGLYRYIRNPRYLGVLIFGLGMVQLFRSWIGLAFLIPFMSILLYRIRDEEVFMEEKSVQCGLLIKNEPGG
jgi:protein-S-isoprenylcysteine O-methyltransferase Ste14